MTYGELYSKAKADFAASGIDSPEADAILLMEHFFSVSKAQIITCKNKEAPHNQGAFLAAVNKRAERCPLQYILGGWSFMGLDLLAGEGVLCPREDTAVLVNAVAEKLSGVDNPVGVDLCAGTGAVGLGLCTLLLDASVFAVEKYDEAFAYLIRNVDSYAEYDICPIKADIMKPLVFDLPKLDFIISNPPYIAADEFAGLLPEIGFEPKTALDGGTDGLDFYRTILSPLWLDRLKPGGIVGLEIGDTQAQAVTSLMQNTRLTDIKLHKDLSGLDRALTAKNKPIKHSA